MVSVEILGGRLLIGEIRRLGILTEQLKLAALSGREAMGWLYGFL